MADRQGGYSHEKKKKKKHYGLSHHDIRADRVVAKVEKSVNLIIGHKQAQRPAGSREHEHNQMDYKDKSKNEGKTKEKYTSMKIPRVKQYDSENNIGRKENNEQPNMIVSGGWVRPNRAMWASPPNSSSSSKPQNNY